MTKTVRVLHVCKSLTRGGVETWIMDIMKEKVKRDDKWELGVCLIGEKQGPYEEEFLRLGGKIHRIHFTRFGIFKFLLNFNRLIKEYEYNIIHTHLYLFNAFIILIQLGGEVKRIAHIHPIEDTKSDKFGRFLYRLFARRVILHGADFIVGPSNMSLVAFVGPEWKRKDNFRVLYNGIDIDRFRKKINRNEVKLRLNIPQDAFIVLNVGRYVEHKRHDFLLEVAREIKKIRNDVYFLCIGDGPLYSHIIKKTCALGVDRQFRFIQGERSIDDYFLCADLFAFPSCNEGFGIVIIESAAAGLPTIAMQIPGVEEAAQACHSVDLLPKTSSSAEWSKMIILRLGQKNKNPDYHVFPFTIQKSYDTLIEIYRTVLKETHTLSKQAIY